jgi:hypothetical protein
MFVLFGERKLGYYFNGGGLLSAGIHFGYASMQNAGRPLPDL